MVLNHEYCAKFHFSSCITNELLYPYLYQLPVTYMAYIIFPHPMFAYWLVAMVMYYISHEYCILISSTAQVA